MSQTMGSRKGMVQYINCLQSIENCTFQKTINNKLEDLKVLRRSPDLFNNVKIGQDQLPLVLIKHILFYYIWGCSRFGQVT